MIVDVIKLGGRPHPFAFRLEPATLDFDADGLWLTTAAEIAGTVRPHSAGTRVEGSLTAAAEVECARCLQRTDFPLELGFAVEYVTAEFHTQAREAELNAADLDVAVYDGAEIDLNEIVREQILLSIPEQVFCAETCEGLCQACGANLNLGDCGCAETEIDPRWAGLLKLK